MSLLKFLGQVAVFSFLWDLFFPSRSKTTHTDTMPYDYHDYDDTDYSTDGMQTHINFDRDLDDIDLTDDFSDDW